MLPEPSGTLVVGCGAIARELLDVIHRSGFDHLSVECLPASLHNTPELIPDAVEERIVAGREAGRTVFVAYGDCGTGGRLDAVLERYEVERLPGAHCYQFFMGGQRFLEEHERLPGTFYLTDYLVRHFERLVWGGLGLDRHPQLRDDYFGNYERVLYISQKRDELLVGRARDYAKRLGLAFAHRHVGYGDLETAVLDIAPSVAGVA